MKLSKLQKKLLKLIYYEYMDWGTYTIPIDFSISSLTDSWNRYFSHKYNGYHSTYSTLRNAIKSLLAKGYLELIQFRIRKHYKLSPKALEYCVEQKFPKFVPPPLRDKLLRSATTVSSSE